MRPGRARQLGHQPHETGHVVTLAVEVLVEVAWLRGMDHGRLEGRRAALEVHSRPEPQPVVAVLIGRRRTGLEGRQVSRESEDLHARHRLAAAVRDAAHGDPRLATVRLLVLRLPRDGVARSLLITVRLLDRGRSHDGRLVVSRRALVSCSLRAD